MNSSVTLSVVIPVFGGENTLDSLVLEIVNASKNNNELKINNINFYYQLNEIILVHDGGSREVGEIIQSLATKYEIVKPVWLSRNFGQHAATLAGFQHSNSEWVITLDEDGRHDPTDFLKLFEKAIINNASVVYAKNIAKDSHHKIKSISSKLLKTFVIKILFLDVPRNFSSFRLLSGEIARALSIYAGRGIYLDAALAWVTDRFEEVQLAFRKDGRRSTYSWKRLFEHFGRLVITTGVPPLRVIFLVGIFSLFLSFGLAGYIFYEAFSDGYPIQGWASIMILMLLFFGVTLFILGLLAEFTGSQLRMSMGQPLYLVTTKPIFHRDFELEILESNAKD